jgi:hypothetical protein
MTLKIEEGDHMKEWNRITKLHRVLKTDNDLWRWWQAQIALKGKDAVTFSQLTPARPPRP